MANEFYNRGATFNPDELADGDAIEAEFDAVARGFDTIGTNVDANKAGYPTQTFHVAPATEATHAPQKAQLDSHINDQGGVHGAASGNSPGNLMMRDENGDVSARTFVGDLLGSGLSQVGSLMVGGYYLTEYGKNGSGEYWRFADGKQICFRSIAADLQTPAIHHFAGYFAVGITPVVLVTNDNGSPAYSSSLNITNEKFEFVSSVSSNTVKVIAIGRWY